MSINPKDISTWRKKVTVLDNLKLHSEVLAAYRQIIWLQRGKAEQIGKLEEIADKLEKMQKELEELKELEEMSKEIIMILGIPGRDMGENIKKYIEQINNTRKVRKDVGS